MCTTRPDRDALELRTVALDDSLTRIGAASGKNRAARPRSRQTFLAGSGGVAWAEKKNPGGAGVVGQGEWARLLGLDAGAVGVRPFVLVAVAAGEERRGRPGALVV